ncbi:MAG: hypothetical protein C5S48_10330 [Candidatus Methanogaster sp.]|nr:MAG: hypothetical protein C5S48_10330 [ANME-2 cluster archaeon]
MPPPHTSKAMVRKIGVLLLSVVLLSVISCGCIRDFERSELGISDIDISVESVASATVLLNVTTYIKNRGDCSEDAQLILKAFDLESGLLVDREAVAVGSVLKRKTRSASQTVKVGRDGGYRIEVVLFEDEQKVDQRTKKISGIGDLTPNVYGIGLRIPEMDFLVKNVTGSKVTIGVDLYIMNEGVATSEDLRILIKAREIDAGLLADKTWITTGVVKKETTVIRSADIVVPDDYNYIVEALIWKNDTIIERGQGVVQLNPRRMIPEKEKVISEDIDVEDFRVPEEAYESGSMKKKTPGFTVLMLLMALILTVLLMKRRQ